jgi:hypothetical protein
MLLNYQFVRLQKYKLDENRVSICQYEYLN